MCSVKEIELLNEKESKTWIGNFEDFIKEFKKEFEYIKESFCENHSDELELMASCYYCKRNRFGYERN